MIHRAQLARFTRDLDAFVDGTKALMREVAAQAERLAAQELELGRVRRSRDDLESMLTTLEGTLDLVEGNGVRAEALADSVLSERVDQLEQEICSCNAENARLRAQLELHGHSG